MTYLLDLDSFYFLMLQKGIILFNAIPNNKFYIIIVATLLFYLFASD